MNDAYIYDGLRTPFGRHSGALAGVRPDDLLAQVLKTLIIRNPFPSELYEDVVVGNANQAGEDSRNIARFSGLLSGLPVSSGGITINRLCGSGLAAVADASRTIRCNEGSLLLAGGVESMSRAPLILSKAATAFDRSQTLADSTLGARFTNPLVISEFGSDTMPQTAENIAVELGISREASDRFALRSQQRYQIALEAGFFTDEILPVTIPGKKGVPDQQIEDDEHPRPGSTLEKLQKLRPLNKGGIATGIVTAGNASGINDGAAALIVGNRAVGDQFNITPRVRIISSAIAGVEPRLMGLGPVTAINKALQRANLTLNDMDVIEINEAFATQVLGCLKQLGLDFDDARVNPCGGAIAIGHPLGASGARLVLSAIRQLERTSGQFAVVSLCIGLGQGIAMVMERV